MYVHIAVIAALAEYIVTLDANMQYSRHDETSASGQYFHHARTNHSRDHLPSSEVLATH